MRALLLLVALLAGCGAPSSRGGAADAATNPLKAIKGAIDDGASEVSKTVDPPLRESAGQIESESRALETDVDSSRGRPDAG